MKNPLRSSAFLVFAFSSAALLAQQSMQPVRQVTVESPTSPPNYSAASLPPDVAASVGVRIVRLSQVNGPVQLDRSTGRGFEVAFANLPITQGMRLRTADAVAEVEFEDGSSLRLTPHTLVEFPVLSSTPDGNRASTIHVAEGEVYASLTKSPLNHIRLTFGKESLALSPSAHVELAVNDKQPRLDVFDGTVDATSGATTTTVARKKALLFDPAGAAPATLIGKTEKGPYDTWDKNAVEYHQRLTPSSSSSYGATPYAFGLADMNYYGGFSMMGGCGMMWQPYLASAGWSPFDNGVWAWYPSAGYSWVSPYPWGWTAFHSGNWNYCPGVGWGWQPGGQWNGLQNVAALTTPARKFPGRLNSIRPPAGPRPAGPTMFAVSQRPLVISRMNGGDSFVFRKDSAGLGVPRSAFGKLNHISASVARHGMVERTAYAAPSPGAVSAQRGEPAMAENRGPGGTHTMSTGERASASPSYNGGGHSTMSSGGSLGSGSFGGGGHMSGGSMGSMGGSASGTAGSSGGHH